MTDWDDYGGAVPPSKTALLVMVAIVVVAVGWVVLT